MDDSQVMHALKLDEAYTVVRVLAEGPAGKTELVTLEGEGPFVRKSFPTPFARPEVWTRVATLDEPLLPRVLQTYWLPDRFVVVCTYVEGKTLEDRISSYGPLDQREAVMVLSDVCRSVAALHEQGIVHRDLTPKNVVLAPDGAHVIDLGIARLRNKEASHDTTTLGTYGFAAPEQFGFAQTDARSDVYSLGRLLGYLLTGHTPDAYAYEQALGDRSVVSASARDLIDQASAFEPSARFQNVDAFARALRLLGEEGALARGDSRSRPAAPAPGSVSAPAPAPKVAPGPEVVPAPNPAPSAGARPHESRRKKPLRLPGLLGAWVDAPLSGAKILVGVLAVAALLFALLFIYVGFILAGQQVEFPWSVSYLLTGCTIALCGGLLPARELGRALMAYGAYAHLPLRPRVLRCLARLLASLLAGFVFIVVVVMVASLLTTSPAIT